MGDVKSGGVNFFCPFHNVYVGWTLGFDMDHIVRAKCGCTFRFNIQISCEEGEPIGVGTERVLISPRLPPGIKLPRDLDIPLEKKRNKKTSVVRIDNSFF